MTHTGLTGLIKPWIMKLYISWLTLALYVQFHNLHRFPWSWGGKVPLHIRPNSIEPVIMVDRSIYQAIFVIILQTSPVFEIPFNINWLWKIISLLNLTSYINLISVNTKSICTHIKCRVAHLEPLVPHLLLGVPKKEVELPILSSISLQFLNICRRKNSHCTIHTVKWEYNSASGLSTFLSYSPFSYWPFGTKWRWTSSKL